MFAIRLIAYLSEYDTLMHNDECDDCQGKTEKPFPMLHCPPQIPHGLTALGLKVGIHGENLVPYCMSYSAT
jgi:hypothetical protein